MSFNGRRFFSVVLLLTVFLTNIFAKKKTAKQGSFVLEDDFKPDETQTVQIAMPEKKDRSFFSNVDPELVKKVEEGSADSLAEVVNELKKKSDSMNDAESTLFFVASSILQICWPSAGVKENISVPLKNAYTGAVESARSGIYDYSTGNTDFLTYALPSLVLAVSDSRNDYFDDSQAALEKALELNPDSVFVSYLCGILCRRQQDFKKSLEFFTKADSLSPGNYEILYGLADINLKLKNYSEAYELSKKIYVQFAQSKTILKLCAETSYYAKDYAAAEQYVGRVLQQEPDNAYYVLFRAKILVGKGDYIRAASLLDAYARTDTISRDYLYLRFKIQKEWNRNISAATQTIESALSKYPEDSDIILAAAALASETGTKIGGKTGDELSMQILSKDPQNVQALQIQISSMIQRKNWTEAYNSSKALLNLPGVPENSIFSHITICLSAGKKEEAWNIAQNLYSKNPASEEVVQAYINVLIQTSRSSDAQKLIVQLLPTANTKMKSFLYYERSFISTSEDAVLADLRSSLTANPRNKDALFRLYTIYFNKKEYRKAQYYLKQVVSLSPNDETLLGLSQELDRLLSN